MEYHGANLAVIHLATTNTSSHGLMSVSKHLTLGGFIIEHGSSPSHAS